MRLRIVLDDDSSEISPIQSLGTAISETWPGFSLVSERFEFSVMPQSADTSAFEDIPLLPDQPPPDEPLLPDQPVPPEPPVEPDGPDTPLVKTLGDISNQPPPSDGDAGDIGDSPGDGECGDCGDGGEGGEGAAAPASYAPEGSNAEGSPDSWPASAGGESSPIEPVPPASDWLMMS